MQEILSWTYSGTPQPGTLDFSTVVQGQTGPTRTFRVSNDGTGPLETANLSVPSGFTVVDGLASSIPVGSYDDFTVQLSTSVLGTFSGNISFTNNDADGGDGIESPFNFWISGSVKSPSVTVIDDGDGGFSAIGTWTTVSGNGYGNDYRRAAGGSGGQAQWGLRSRPASTGWR